MRRKNFLRRKAVKFIERCGITKWLKSCVLLNIFKVLNWKTMSECQTRASPSILNYTKIDRNSKIHWQWKIPSNSLQNNVDWRWGAIFECGRRRKMYWNWWFLFLDLKIALNVGWNFSIFFFLLFDFFLIPLPQSRVYKQNFIYWRLIGLIFSSSTKGGSVSQQQDLQERMKIGNLFMVICIYLNEKFVDFYKTPVPPHSVSFTCLINSLPIKKC